MKPHATLVQFEDYTQLGPTYVAKLLGVSYVTYAMYRSGRRKFPLYHERHIEALLALPHSRLMTLIERHAHGSPT